MHTRSHFLFVSLFAVFLCLSPYTYTMDNADEEQILSYMLDNGDTEGAQHLIACKANINALSNYDAYGFRETLLHRALRISECDATDDVHNCHIIPIVRLLLENSASLDYFDRYATSCLSMGARNACPAVLQLFIDHKNLSGMDLYRPLLTAASQNKWHSVYLLLEHDAYFRQPTYYNLSSEQSNYVFELQKKVAKKKYRYNFLLNGEQEALPIAQLPTALIVLIAEYATSPIITKREQPRLPQKSCIKKCWLFIQKYLNMQDCLKKRKPKTN